MESEQITYVVAFIAGLLTFLSPCLLPLIPSFVMYITGISSQELKDADKRVVVRQKTVAHALLFILGFSVVFILLGLTATALGRALFQYQKAIRIAGGILIIIFGLHLTGALNLDFLVKERRFVFTTKGASFIGSFMVGVTFAAAWTPCAGPILGSILILAGTKSSVTQGAVLLSLYALGIAVPFFITSLLVDSFLVHMKRFQKAIGVINVISGAFLMIVGILVATNYLAVISERVVGVFTR